MDKENTEDYFGGKKKKKEEPWVNLDRERFPELYNSFDSIYPSYSNLAVAYPVICRQRFHLMRILYAQQLHQELRRMERLQQRALRGVRTYRTFSEGFHVSPRDLKDPLKKNERRRLEALLNTRKTFGE